MTRKLSPPDTSPTAPGSHTPHLSAFPCCGHFIRLDSHNAWPSVSGFFRGHASEIHPCCAQGLGTLASGSRAFGPVSSVPEPGPLCVRKCLWDLHVQKLLVQLMGNSGWGWLPGQVGDPTTLLSSLGTTHCDSDPG